MPGRRACAWIVRRNGEREPLPSKKMIVLHPGDQLWEYISGGAGYGDPLDRDAGLVLADVRDGKVSRDSALDTYGVVLTADGIAIDEVATKVRRERERCERGPVDWVFDRGLDGRGA
jgi:N-methylhydantoinase B